MQVKLMTAMLMVVTVGAAGAQSNESSATATNNAATNPPPARVSTPTTYGGPTNTFQPGPVFPEEGSFGVGAMIGEPMGVTFKYWLSDIAAVDGGIGWSFEDKGGTQVHGDVLWHKFDLIRADMRDMPVYVGVGGRVKFIANSDNRAGFRVPVGIEYLVHNQPIELYAEVAPILDVAPSTTMEWNGGIGIRYYFH
jgi:hypothetical protein